MAETLAVVDPDPGKIHDPTSNSKILVVTTAKTNCKNGCDIRCGSQVEGFVFIGLLSIFDERIDGVELQRGASTTTIPLSDEHLSSY